MYIIIKILCCRIMKNWTYNEGKALINVYANRKDEYFKMRNKKYFWENILTDLEALNILVCNKKRINFGVHKYR